MQNPLIEGFNQGLQIPYEGTVEEWISEFVVMPHSARSKKNDKTVTPQWTEIFNAANNPQYRCITVLAPPGGGKTGGIECLTSWILKNSPGPTGIYSQTDETTEFWAKTRLQKVFESTPPVANLLPKDPFAIKKDEMHFPHMYIVLGGANITNTQEKSLQYAIGDEVWKWKHGLIKELEARLHDRYNGKLWLFSQGGWTDSELEERFLKGTQHFWGFTCPHCKQWSRFSWSLFSYTKVFNEAGNVDWQKTEKSVVLQCPTKDCQKWEDNTRNRRYLCNLGSYKPTNDNHVQDWASFQFSAFGVWQIPWGRLVREWIIANEAKKHHDLELLQKFIQKRCVEFADESVVESLESEPLYNRREHYTPDTLPNSIIAISAGVDTQDDRLEVTSWGYGNQFESWPIEHKIFLGDPTNPEVWNDLEDFRLKNYVRKDGTIMNINIMGIDTGRHPNDVYAYVRPRQSQKVYAFKGSSEHNMPIVSRPKKSGVEKARLFMVGTDTAKTRIYSRLQIQKPGDWKDGAVAGYIHFCDSDDFDESWFKQLVSEKVITKIVRGERIKTYEKHGRNEALDCRVYADAAMQILNPNFEKLASRLQDAKREADAQRVEVKTADAEGEGTSAEVEDQEERDTTQVISLQAKTRSIRRRRIGRGGWLGGRSTNGFLR